MKNVTNSFKNDIRTYGRQLDFKIKINNVDANLDDFGYIKPSFNAGLFKTIMHCIEVDSKNEIEKNSTINLQAGVKLNENNYEYIDYNTYFVNSIERQEDTLSYTVKAYDKMVESMIDFDLIINEEMTLRNYLLLICQRLGWNTQNIPATFINSSKMVNPNLHTGIQYTFRDALDEIATLSCSNLVFLNDEFYLLYPRVTNENIDESYLNEDNVTIGEKYFINSLVFSRAEGSDNIYRKDDESIELNGLHEFKISDNQLLSTNDRDLYIDEMFDYLKTIEFYLFDIESKGILFFEACDMFNLVLGENTYPTLLLNDEITFDDGLTEGMYLDAPGETETEYKYADSTDKRINQTYIIVDKQNQQIQSLVTQIGDRSEKTTSITQDVDRIESSIQDIEDVTITGETNYASLSLANINRSEPFLIQIHPVREDNNISYLYPSSYLYPYDELYSTTRTLRFIRTYEEDGITKTQNYDYELPCDLLYYEENDKKIYDEFYLNYETKECKVIKRCIQGSDRLVQPLDIEETITYDYPTIDLYDGDYEIQLVGYDYGYIKATLMEKNKYTTQFTSKVEMNSSISQTAEEINLEVSKKVGNDEVISRINQSAEQISIDANKININGTVSANGNFIVDTDGNMICNNGTFNGGEITLQDNGSTDERYSVLKIEGDYGEETYISSSILNIKDGNQSSWIDSRGFSSLDEGNNNLMASIGTDGIYYANTGTVFFQLDTNSCYIRNLTQGSLEKLKKNIKPVDDDVIKILKESDIYKFDFKDEENNQSKHYGFVIGEKYRTPKILINEDKDNKPVGIDMYSMTSILWKIAQEQQKQIEKLQEEVNKLKGSDNND